VEVRPAEMRLAEIGPAEIRLAEVCFVKVRLAEVHLAEVCLAEVRFAKVRPAKVRLLRFVSLRFAPLRSALLRFDEKRSAFTRSAFCIRKPAKSFSFKLALYKLNCRLEKAGVTRLSRTMPQGRGESYRERAEEALFSHSLKRTGVRLSLVQEVAEESCRRCTGQKYPHQGMNTNCYKYASTHANACHLYDAKQEPQPAPEEDFVRRSFQVLSVASECRLQARSNSRCSAIQARILKYRSSRTR
jgi:hypothetical protein